MKVIALLLSLGLPVLAAIAPMRAQGADEAPPTPTFLVLYSPGPSWPAGATIAQLPLREHGRYMLDLYAQGSLQMAGPFVDDSGAAVVLRAADERAATALVDADPAVKAGVFVYRLEHWRVVDWEPHLRKRRAAEAEAAARGD